MKDRERLWGLTIDILSKDSAAAMALDVDGDVQRAYDIQVAMGKKLVELRQHVNDEIDEVELECPDFADWLEEQEEKD